MTFHAFVRPLNDRCRLCRLRRATRAGVGRGDSPIFSQCDSRGGQVVGRRVRSGHRGRPGRRGGHETADRADLSRPWRDRRGIWSRSPRGGICLGPRSDRRDQELRFRPADLGHLDRAHASRPAGLRHDGAAVHPRAVLWRRQTRQAAHARPRPRRRPADGMGDPEPAHPRLRFPCRSDADDDEPVADSGRIRPGGLYAGRKARSGSRATAATATPFARWRPASPTW